MEYINSATFSYKMRISKESLCIHLGRQANVNGRVPVGSEKKSNRNESFKELFSFHSILRSVALTACVSLNLTGMRDSKTVMSCTLRTEEYP